MSESVPLPEHGHSRVIPPSLDQREAAIRVTQFENSSGEGPYHCADGHTLFMSLAARPVHYLQTQDGKTYT
ncbi:MAG: hypothetical protein AAFY17_10535, partial [Cyanobacteria bacterium J06642_11]